MNNMNKIDSLSNNLLPKIKGRFSFFFFLKILKIWKKKLFFLLKINENMILLNFFKKFQEKF